MTTLDLVCPCCGAAIVVDCVVQPGANGSAKPGANPPQIEVQNNGQAQIAHVSKALDLDPAPKRARAYNQGYDQEFLAFWKVYPRKRAKRQALLSWRKSVARIVANGSANRDEAIAQILAGALRYRDDPNRVDEFTQYAQTWLNGDGWEDEPLPVRGRARLEPAAPDPHAWESEASAFLEAK